MIQESHSILRCHGPGAAELLLSKKDTRDYVKLKTKSVKWFRNPHLMLTVKVCFKSHILQRAFQYLRNIDGILFSGIQGLYLLTMFRKFYTFIPMISSGFAVDLILSINSHVETDFPAVLSMSAGNCTEILIQASGFKYKF